MVGLKTDAKKKSRNDFRITELWDCKQSHGFSQCLESLGEVWFVHINIKSALVFMWLGSGRSGGWTP